MANHDRESLEDLFQLACRLANDLEPLSFTGESGEPDALAFRLAQAHALGLVDQLAEIVHRHPGAAVNSHQPRTLDDEMFRPH